MKLSLKFFHFLSRIIVIEVGLLLLLTIIPHTKPWAMQNVTRLWWNENALISIRFPFSSQSLIFPEAQMWWAALFFVLVILCFSPKGRKAVMTFLQPKPANIIGWISIAVFVFTLVPGGNQQAPVIVYFLLFGAVSIFLLFWGMYPLTNELCRKLRFKQVVISIWEKLRCTFLKMNAAVFLGVLFVFVFTFTNLASYFLFEHIPHVGDSISQVFQAKIFTEGKLTAQSHQHREFFDLINGNNDHPFIINNGKWYSMYPPGHSFLLMFGILLNAPWLVNPLLGALTIIALYFLGKELYDETTGRLAALLGAISPFILFMSSEYMNHASALFFFTLFLLYFAKTARTQKVIYAVAAGAALGMVFLIRPLTAVALAMPFCIYGTFLFIRKSSLYRRPLLLFVALLLVFGCMQLIYNALTTGNPFVYGYIALHGEEHLPGFGHAAWGSAHTPAKGLHQTLNNLNGMNKFLFEWPIPSLIFVFLLFVTHTSDKWDYLLLAAFFALTFAYFFYWYQDWTFGPRFLYESATMLILLTARGIRRLPILFNRIFNLSITTKKTHMLTAALVVFCFLVAMAGSVPVLIKLYGSDFAGVNADVLRAVKEKGISKAVVFTRSYYGSVYTANTPLLDSDIIYARDLGEKNHLLMKAYPDYRYFLADGKNIRLLPKKQ